jgi:hypothetical protein
MTLTDVEPVGAVGTVSSEWDLWLLDREVEELFSDIDEFLSTALHPRLCPPPPPRIAGDTAKRPAPTAVRPRNRSPDCTALAEMGRATQRAPPAGTGA